MNTHTHGYDIIKFDTRCIVIINGPRSVNSEGKTLRQYVVGGYNNKYKKKLSEKLEEV